MTWVKLDDGFYMNRKARLVGKDGRALFIAGLCHCSSQLTDGHIATVDLAVIAAQAEVKPSTASTLVDNGLWIKVDDGWLVHDYPKYNRPAASVRAEREEGRKRAAASSERRREASREERTKNIGSFNHASTDPSSSSSSPLLVTSGGSSSSSTLISDDDDWPLIVAKRRLQSRESDLGAVSSRKKWLLRAVDDVLDDHRADADAFRASCPSATALDIANHVEPPARGDESSAEQGARVQAERARREGIA